MTDLANLAIKVDSSSVKTGVDDLKKLTPAAKQAQGAVDDLGKASSSASGGMRTASQAANEMAAGAQKAAGASSGFGNSQRQTNTAVDQAERFMRKASIQLADMAQKEREAASGADEVARSAKGAGQAASEMAREAQRAAERATNVGKASGAAGYAVRNLSYQITDVVQGFLTGQKPMQIFAQQGFQIADALGQIAFEAKRSGQSVGGILINSMGKLGPAILVVGAALGTATVGLKVFQSQVNSERSAELETYARSLGLTKEQIEEVGGAAVTSGDLLLGLWDIIKQALDLEDVFADLKGFIVDTFTAAAQDAKKNVSEIYAAVAGTVDAIKLVWDRLPAIIGEAVINAANNAIAAVERLINANIAALKSLASFVDNAFGTNLSSNLGDVSLGRIENKFAGAGAAAADAVTAGYRNRLEEAQGAFDTFFADWAEAGANRAKQRLAGALEEGDEIKDAAERVGKEAGEAMMPAFAQAALEALPGALDAIQGQLNTYSAGVLGGELFSEIEKTLINAGQDRRIATREMEAAEAAAEALNNQLRDTVDLLDSIGRSGRSLGDLASILVGLTSGDFSGVRGPGGALATQLLTTVNDKGERVLNDFAKNLNTTLDRVFGGTGTFAQTMNQFLQGAGTGAAIGQIAFGSQSGQLGATLGGAIGQAAGAEFLGALGNFAGPVGAIAGSILGGLVGGALKSTPRGKATFSGGLDFGLSGNSASRRGAAGGLAGNVVDALQQIADAFGADLTGFTGTIGIRKGNLRYDPTGQGITKTSKGALDFGQDEEALLRAAIEDAISDGVFEGLSAGVERILQGEGSVDQKIADALSFQSVFDELERLKDPLGAALNEFEDQAAVLQGVFDKAGASVEEYAQLEEYLGIKRQEVIDQFSQVSEIERQQRELEIEIMRLQGDEQGALAAARQLELESLPESVKALQERVYALQDEALAAQQAAAVESERQSLNIRLAEALGDAEEVLRLRREAELAAVDPLNRALLESVQAAEQAALAQQRLAQAQAQAASSATSAASALSGAAGGNALGAIQDPLIGGVVSQFLTGTLDVNSAANQIRQAFSDQATAAFPNDLIQRSAFYNELVNSVAPQGGTPSFGIGTGPNAGGGGNPGDPGNGLSGSLGSGQQRSGSVRDAYVSLGGLQLWAQALMGGAGIGDLPGWGGFSSPAARERALARFGDLGNDGGRPGITQDQSAELSDAYNREASEINKVISEYEKLRETLKAFDESLEIVGQTPRDTYAILRARFLETAGNAATGDKDALAALPGVGNQFLGAAERNASTSLQFRRDVALVRSAVGGGIAATDEAIDYQEAQLDALNRQVDGMIELKEEVRTVAEILRGIQGDNADFRREQQAENIAAVKNSAATAKTLDRVSQNGSSLRVDLTV